MKPLKLIERILFMRVLPSRRSVFLPALLLAAISWPALLAPPARAADHRDGPIFGPPGITVSNSRRDINDIYVFRSPSNRDNTVLIMDVSPFSSATTPGFFDEDVFYDFKIANRDLSNPTEDITFHVKFGPRDGKGRQHVQVHAVPHIHFGGNSGVIANGRTGENIEVRGGGMFRAAEQDDPFFFDAVGFNQLLNGGAFPRPPGVASNFFGPNVNTLSIILEVPSDILRGPSGNLIGVWGRTASHGKQLDRMGRPAINTALIPPVPRGPNFPIGATADLNRQERRNDFNAGRPAGDRADFTEDMVSVLRNFYGRTEADSRAISGLLLPDLVVFELGNSNGFGTFLTAGGNTYLGNGRRLRDDVIDVEVNVLTNGAITTDNVADDNGTKITDGNAGTVAAFPYIGARNTAPTPVPGQPPPP
jgi:hypothetical protein